MKQKTLGNSQGFFVAHTLHTFAPTINTHFLRYTYMTAKEKKIKNFDPNAPGDINNNLFGLPFEPADAEVVIIPVPWDGTASYSGGTAHGPQAIFDASMQVDLYFEGVKDAWKLGIAMDEIPEDWATRSADTRAKTEKYFDFLADGGNPDESAGVKDLINYVNKTGEELAGWVKAKSLEYLKQGKIVGVLGGEHSTPLGLMRALAEHHGSYGILQIDAHADLRNAYEGFEHSHASIMNNALKIEQVEKLVQVGIRDICQEEVDVIESSNGRVKTFYYAGIAEQMYEGSTFASITKDIIKALPDNVYISFDIDGLDPKLCPNTGTPVAGGLEFHQAVYIIQQVVKAGKRIIGFDLNEVAPGGNDEWDANVGARMLYNMANYTALSQGKFNQ